MIVVGWNGVNASTTKLEIQHYTSRPEPVILLCSSSLLSLAIFVQSLNTFDIRYLHEEGGMSLEQTNFDGKRPLHDAAQFCQLTCVKYLIGQGNACNFPSFPPSIEPLLCQIKMLHETRMAFSFWTFLAVIRCSVFALQLRNVQ